MPLRRSRLRLRGRGTPVGRMCKKTESDKKTLPRVCKKSDTVAACSRYPAPNAPSDL